MLQYRTTCLDYYCKSTLTLPTFVGVTSPKRSALFFITSTSEPWTNNKNIRTFNRHSSNDSLDLLNNSNDCRMNSITYSKVAIKYDNRLGRSGPHEVVSEVKLGEFCCLSNCRILNFAPILIQSWSLKMRMVSHHWPHHVGIWNWCK